MRSVINHWLASPRPGAACAVVAEVAQAHDGSLGMAHAFIDSAADAGATAVKFQTHIAVEESTAGEPWRVKFSRQDETRYAYWKRMEFAPEQWAGLKRHAEEKELVFLSSPFSMAAVELLRGLGITAWKVASGELTNTPMIASMAADGIPVMLSTGLSAWPEVDAAVKIVTAKGAPFAVMQCTTRYPSPPDAIGLNVLGEIRRRYGCATGLSDHSGTIYPSLAAIAADQVEVVEVHLTLSREMFGPDVPASVTPHELKQICDGARFIAAMRGCPLDKSTIDPAVAPLRNVFFKSLMALDDLPAGSVLGLERIAIKKPGTGIPASEVERFAGRKLKRAVKRDVPLQYEDFEPE